MTACLSFHWQRVLPHFCLGMRRNKAFRFSHLSFFAFSFDILKSIGLASNLKKSEKALIIETGNFYHGVHVVTCSRNKSGVFHSTFTIFIQISGSTELITLTWVSVERSFPPAEVEHRLCQFWSKVMTSELEP